MKNKIIPVWTAILSLIFVAFLSGCSTVDGRISKNQQLFDSLAPAVQSNIRAGKVDVGYAPEWVMMALGEPDRRYTRTTEHGSSEVWAYASKAPALSFGIGVGGGGGGTAVGTGIGVTTGGDRSDDKTRVVFEGGKVTAVEQTK